MSGLRSALASQFAHPRGLLGRLAGLIMRLRPSNRERGQRVLSLLALGPEDRVLEIGFGPGLAIERAAALASRGAVYGIDRSELMLREARRRNAAAIDQGRVVLLLGSAEQLPALPSPLDKVFAINVYMFWKRPAEILRGVRRAMRPGGTIALALQPRNAGASEEDARAAAEAMAGALAEAGFINLRSELLPMEPVSTACALGEAPPEGDPTPA
jgi:SAM-dependent methyltransferase